MYIERDYNCIFFPLQAFDIKTGNPSYDPLPVPVIGIRATRNCPECL